MKNLVKFLVPAAVAALALVSCNKEENYTAPEENAVTIRVHASASDLLGEDGTKTYIDNTNTIIWGTGEYMKLALTAGENTTFATSTDVSADLFNGDSEAMFEFSVSPEAANEYVYQGIYPASAVVASSNTNAANYKVNLPTIQNATASSYDPAAYIMVAKPESFASVQTDWEASFLRGTALNKMTLKNVPTGVSFNKVKITAEGKKLAGGRHFNLTTGAGSDVYGTEATIEVLYATPITGTSVDVWFTSWDVEIAESEKLTVVAYTTDNKSYTKEITVPSGKSIKFKERYLNTLGVSLTGITPENVSTFAAGDYVILAKKDDSNFFALKGEASGTRIASVNYTGSLTSYSGDASIIWTIAASGTGYTIKNGGNFVGWTSGNYADLIPEADYDATKCLMGIDDNGDGTYKIYVLADASRMLARNTSNAYFAFYAGTQYKDIVFVPATALEQVATPTFDPAAGAVASGSTVSISCATSGATIHYTVDGTDPTASSATYSSPITITSTTTIKAIAVKSDMADSEIASATYTVSGSTPTTGWFETEFSAIGANEEFVIVGDNGNTYALKANGSSNAPLAAAVTVSGTELTGTLDDAIKWTLSGDATNGFVFYPKGSTTTWLYTTTSNNGLRVGTSEHNKVKLDATSGYLTINDGSTTRYIGIYNSQDWRSYTSVNSNISGQTFKFYKYVDGSTPTVATPTFSFVSAGNKVSISCATAGATIYYTTNGADPTTSSNVYSEAISLSGDQMTIKAFATKSSYDDSAIASTTYYAINRAATTNGSISANDYAAEGDEVTITVTPDSGYTLGTLSVTDSSSNAVSVSSNKFTMPASSVTISATFNLIAVTNIADALSAPGTYEVPDVLVYAVKGNALILGDSSGKIYAYKSGHGLSVGDVRTVSGSTIWYNSGDVYEFDSPTFSGSGTSAVNHGTAIEFADNAATLQTETGFASTGSGAAHTAVYVHAIGDQSGRNITTSNGKVLYLSAAESATDGKTVEVYGYVYAYSASHTNFNFLATSIEEYVDPNAKSITALKSSITGISADGVTNAAETGVYSLTNASDSDVTVTPDGTVVTSASVSGGTLTYSVAANTGAARSGSVTLAVSGGNSVEITISQEKASGSTGGTLTVDFESATSAYADWTFNNMTTQQTNSNVSAHGGSYFGTTGGKTSATLTTANKIANPAAITFYISKTSTNTTASSWRVRVSSDGSTWTNVGSDQSASSGVTRGTWYEVTRDLSSYSNVYVQIQYDGTSAVRTIDDVTLTYN